MVLIDWGINHKVRVAQWVNKAMHEESKICAFKPH